MTHDEAVLAAKIALEREVMVPIYRAISAYIMAWARAEGRVSIMERAGHQSAVERVLQRHYARVVHCMRGQVPPREATIEGAALSLRHATSLRNRAQTQSRRIIEATDNDLARLLREAEAEIDAQASAMEAKAQGRGGGFSVLYEGKFKTTAEQAHRRARRRAKPLANKETEETAEETRFEWVEQNKATGKIVKVWQNMGDERVRGNPAGIYKRSPFDHWSVHGQERDVEQPFEVSGEALKFPGDTSLGASLGNVINCFPAGTKVSGVVTAATRHWYEGDLVEISTRSGRKLSGTPNHPILTTKGWVAMGLLNEGDDLVCAGSGRRLDGFGQMASAGLMLNDAENVDHVEPGIEQVFDAISVHFASVREIGLAVNFHGDVPASDVDVVRADSPLRYGVDPAFLERSHQFSLRFPDLGEGGGLSHSFPSKFTGAGRDASARVVSGFGQGLSGLRAGLGHPGEHALGPVSRLESSFLQSQDDLLPVDAKVRCDPLDRATCGEHRNDIVHDLGAVGLSDGGVVISDWSRDSSLANPREDCGSRDSQTAGDIGDAETTLVKFDRIVSVRRYGFVGHVYNLECVHGLYHANGVVVHNCRCTAQFIAVGPNGERIPIGLETPHVPAKRTWHPGDRLGKETPVNPTSLVTLNGTTRARIVLGDGHTFATLRQVSPSTLEILVNRQVVARATHQGENVTSLTIAPGWQAQGMEKLIRESVRHSARREWLRSAP